MTYLSGPETIVAALPGTHWLVHFVDDDGVAWDEPVLVFTVNAEGDVYPQTVDGSGRVAWHWAAERTPWELRRGDRARSAPCTCTPDDDTKGERR